MAKQNHIIRKTRLEVEVSDMTSAMEWQERLSRFANGPLAARLSEVFDQQSQSDEVIRIDRMEVSAEVMKNENWKEVLLDSIVRQVADEIPTRRKSQPSDLEKRRGGNVISTRENIVSSFFHFLKTGRLPWSIPSDVREHFEERLVEVFEKEITPPQREEFRRLIQSEEIRKRLTLQFSEDSLRKIVISFLQKNTSQVIENQEHIQAFAKSVKWKMEGAVIQFWENILAKPDEKIDTVARSVVASHLAERPAILFKSPMFSPSQKGLDELKYFAEQKPKRKNELVKWATENKGSFEHFVSSVFAKNEFQEDMIPKFFPKGKSKTKADMEMRSKEGARPSPGQPWFMPEEDIFVQNAGVVILHPFLPMLFEALGFAKNEKLLKPHRAVHLIHFLATGGTGAMEHEMPLNKMLCGLPLAASVRRNIRLTKKEKTEAEKMLGAVIGHWPSLGKTSVDGLRGTYLCREGKLTKSSGGGWRLQVEQKAFDVLLADLRWSISRVQTRFMPEPLWVEWG